MKNYWLDKKICKVFSNLEFEGDIEQYRSSTLLGMDIETIVLRLQARFRYLAVMILATTKHIKFDDEKGVIEDCIKMCFDKMYRFNPDKGKAFNFFTTCILGYMRQIYMCERDIRRS